MQYSCFNTLEVDLQVLVGALTRVREVLVLGENLAGLSSLAPSLHNMCGAMGAALDIMGACGTANEPVHATVTGRGDVDLGSRGTPNVRPLVLTDYHRAVG